MDRPEVRQVAEGRGEQRKMEETGCEVICGAPTIAAVKGWVKVKKSQGNLPTADVSININVHLFDPIRGY